MPLNNDTTGDRRQEALQENCKAPEARELQSTRGILEVDDPGHDVPQDRWDPVEVGEALEGWTYMGHGEWTHPENVTLDTWKEV